MASQGIVAQPRVWILYARWAGLAPAVKAGEYEIQPGITPRELLAKMVSGQVLLHSFTIVDGWRLKHRWFWPENHNRVLDALLAAIDSGTRVICSNNSEPVAS